MKYSFAKTFQQSYYTPGIYAEGYIVFAFPFGHSYVRSFVRTSVTFVEFMTKFFTEVRESFSSGDISHEPLVRKHSYLNNRYPEGSAFIP